VNGNGVNEVKKTKSQHQRTFPLRFLPQQQAKFKKKGRNQWNLQQQQQFLAPPPTLSRY
jgi:hypothetical protein